MIRAPDSLVLPRSVLVVFRKAVGIAGADITVNSNPFIFRVGYVTKAHMKRGCHGNSWIIFVNADDGWKYNVTFGRSYLEYVTRPPTDREELLYLMHGDHVIDNGDVVELADTKNF